MTDYSLLGSQLKEIIETEPWYVSALSNASALLMEMLPDLNWAGFYLLRDGRLCVGPFQGKPACIHIEEGKGVCGTCVKTEKTVLVPDVHAFPGHIACDSASRSEIVVPVFTSGGHLAGVMDLDSPLPDRFSQEDADGLEKAAEILKKCSFFL